MKTGENDIAIYGLGVMGSGLAKNLLSRGYRVSVYSKSGDERRCFFASHKGAVICETPEQLLGSLKAPRVVFLMVTAGRPVDQVLEELTPLLQKGDVVIDGGNSHFADTDRRTGSLAGKGVHYLGVGISGGEEGAVKGPSMMAGGSRAGWSICGEMLRNMAARFEGEPCCDYIGPGGAGHYVKMIHNGIEYAILQLIADVYSIMKNGLDMSHRQILQAFQGWRSGPLGSYLIDITCNVLSVMDEDGSPLVEKILDVAGQKGTGKWTLAEAVEKGIYIPTICESVFMRYFSAKRALRECGSKRLTATVTASELENPREKLQDALLAGMICSYAQGIELMQAASDQYGWDIDMPKTISLWRAGCIIRSRLLSNMLEAVKEECPHVILSGRLSCITSLEPALRQVVVEAVKAGLAIPTLASALSWYDCCRTEQMPVNIVQALRDCFGAHTYERTDRSGVFHTSWPPNQS